jgi:hypothetical protein
VGGATETLTSMRRIMGSKVSRGNNCRVNQTLAVPEIMPSNTAPMNEPCSLTVKENPSWNPSVGGEESLTTP